MRIKAIVSYDGSEYKGWQRQPHGNSVQQAIEKGLAEFHKKEIIVVASGRTDAGVHALGQVIHFDTDLTITEEKWVRAMNRHTPRNIHFIKAEIVDDEFHSRFHTTGKTYEYRFSLEPFNVHRYKYCTYVEKKLDVDKMIEAADVFVGTHDFTSFCANTLIETPNQVRTVNEISFRKEGEEWVVTFSGDGFLRYMVRMLMATLMAIGEGRITKEDAKNWLEAKDKRVCRFNAPPNGLYLKEVRY
ncbi:MAG: tRNA pseudouridine(38-40) synthase TruA [Erysipelotrichales bacterium]|nr:tRNA pseudouridine(38-40) synthase TruA [Erysipelotrichales bacterium]